MADAHDEAGTPQNGDGSDGTVVGAGRIVDLEIDRELQESYLTYAMSTIMDRALPDVRDGLKPSQRRILVAMNDNNLRPGRKHLKCAKIAGDTSGNYHPHGESVIYPTLVGLAQKWRMRVPLIDPQGNFGSIEGDPPAAMRYTEARMHHAAVDMLQDMDLSTVDMQANYDERLMEPKVLPGRFPNLLINGSLGIAVGMATSMPPHNPTEILDAITRVVDNPEIELLELMQDELDEAGEVVRLGVKGPDFPTGGVIVGRRGIGEAYANGRGKVYLRGVCHVEELNKDRQQLVIDEIPYNLSQRNLVEKIVDAVQDERIKDISDIRNESGRQAMTRVVIELKRGADPAVIENQLYQFTPLQQTFSIINIALVGRRPVTLGLKEIIEHYIDHRVEVIRRRTEHLLREARRKAHLLEGQIYAVVDIDEIVALIRGSSTREEAIEKLMERRYRIPPEHPAAKQIPQRLLDHVAKFEELGGVALTRHQAEQIGSMRLIQLVGLEIERLVDEYTKLADEITDYEDILANRPRVMGIIREDCETMKARYGNDRRTAIEDAVGEIDMESLIREHDVVVTISRAGYAKRVPAETYRAQARGGKGIRAGGSKDEDFVQHLFVASTHDHLLCFTNTGRVFKMKVYELPEMARTAKGRAIVNLLDLKEGEKVWAFLTIKDFEASSQFLTFATRGGIVKRTPLSAYRNVNRSGLIAVGLKEGDELFDVSLTSGTDDLLLVTNTGMAIRFSEGDVRVMGRSAAGVKGIDLGDDAKIIGLLAIPMVPDDDDDGEEHWATAPEALERNLCLLTVTETGYGKRTPVDEYRVQPESGKPRSQSRGGKGRRDIATGGRNGMSVAAVGLSEGEEIMVISRSGQLVRMAGDTIREVGRGSKGVRVVSLNGGDDVIAVAPVAESDDEDAGESGGEAVS
ncbi:MAG: DNA gyrase subunit A [Phycisphaera sp.]|nr:MAG: DNA gyrase subunit A [Phycisphaera sp.]